MTPLDPENDPAWAFYRQGVQDALSFAQHLGPPGPGGGVSWRAHSLLPDDDRYVELVVEAAELPSGRVAWIARVEQPLGRWRVSGPGGFSVTLYAEDEATAKDSAAELSRIDGAHLSVDDLNAFRLEQVTLAVPLSVDTHAWLRTIAAQNPQGIRDVGALGAHVLGSLSDGARRVGCWERRVLAQLVGEPVNGWGLPARGDLARHYRRPLPEAGMPSREWTMAVAAALADQLPLREVPELVFPTVEEGLRLPWLLAFLHHAVRAGDRLRATGWLVLFFFELGGADFELLFDDYEAVHLAALTVVTYSAGLIADALQPFVEDGLDLAQSSADELLAALCDEGRATHAG